MNESQNNKNIGDLALDAVIESAVITYLADKPAEVVAVFENFIAAHHEDSDLLEKMCDQFPEFEMMLAEQAAAMDAALDEGE